ncbi:MAG: hypothetical protein H7067_11620 [Burkholderiales bacterium]|nr:hypothetical protein [Opitutaceae bacterium]
MKKIILALAATGLVAVSHAQTSVARTEGALSLLAGFDFNNGSGSSYTQMNARYSDLFSPSELSGNAASPGNAAFGTVYFTTNGGTFASAVARPTVGFDSTDRQITTRSVGVDFLGELSGGDGAFNPNTTAAVTRDFVFLVTALNAFNSFENINLDLSAHSNNASSTVTVNWLYATSAGGEKIATGLSTLVGGTTYARSSVDFSSVAGMDGVDDLYIVARVTESADNASLFLDNVAIYGTATAIPEPSSFAALAGIMGLGLATQRRRRSVRA